jgi:hypothetical protein
MINEDRDEEIKEEEEDIIIVMCYVLHPLTTWTPKPQGMGDKPLMEITTIHYIQTTSQIINR